MPRLAQTRPHLLLTSSSSLPHHTFLVRILSQFSNGIVRGCDRPCHHDTCSNCVDCALTIQYRSPRHDLSLHGAEPSHFRHYCSSLRAPNASKRVSAVYHGRSVAGCSIDCTMFFVVERCECSMVCSFFHTKTIASSLPIFTTHPSDMIHTSFASFMTIPSYCQCS